MDPAEFTRLTEPHRLELRVHCYRMAGSYDEAEDLVQETFLRAWRTIDGFAGRSSVRTWLYRIATNLCLDVLAARSRRILPDQLTGETDPGEPRADVAWLQPFPDPGDAAIDRETLELAFLVAIQHLPPRQRAVLLLRDVLGWPASRVADTLGTGVAAANSALQRARATMRERLPERRLDWSADGTTTERDRALLRRYMAAVERADLAAVAELLAEDVRTTMPPFPWHLVGRAANLAALTESWDPASPDYVGRFRMVETRANGRLATASWTTPDGSAYRAFAITVMDLRDDRIAGLTAFQNPHLFPAFGLPMTLPASGRLPVRPDDHGG